MKADAESIAIRDFSGCNFADTIAVTLPPGASRHPEVWAETIFAPESAPFWVRSAFTARDWGARLLRIPPGTPTAFRAQKVEGNEALVAVSEKHVDFRAGIAVRDDTDEVRVTTAARFIGVRGRLYACAVRIGHRFVVRAMLRGAAERLSHDE